MKNLLLTTMLIFLVGCSCYVRPVPTEVYYAQPRVVIVEQPHYYHPQAVVIARSR